MIARTWTGRTAAADHEAYLAYLNETGVGVMRRTEGNLGVFVLRRLVDETAEFLLISLWDSYESIERFAGPNRDTAVYYPEDRRYLTELEPRVRHYEALSAPHPVADPPPCNAVGAEALFWMFSEWRRARRADETVNPTSR